MKLMLLFDSWKHNPRQIGTVWNTEIYNGVPQQIVG